MRQNYSRVRLSKQEQGARRLDSCSLPGNELHAAVCNQNQSVFMNGSSSNGDGGRTMNNTEKEEEDSTQFRVPHLRTNDTIK